MTGTDDDETSPEFAELAADAPDAVLDQLDTVISNLAADDEDSKYDAARALEILSETDRVDDLAPAITPLANSLEKYDSSSVRSLHALSHIAADTDINLTPILEDVVPALGYVKTGACTHAARTIRYTASSSPTAGVEHIDIITEHLEDNSAKVRWHLTAAIRNLAKTHPDAVKQHALYAVIERLDDSHRFTQGFAASAIGHLAKEHPRSVTPTIPKLTDQLFHDYPKARFRAAFALSYIAQDCATDVIRDSDIWDITYHLADDHKNVRRYAARTLGRIAKTHPEEIEIALPKLSDLLTDDYEWARTSAAATLKHYGKHYPGNLFPYADTLLDNLDDPHPNTQKWIIKAIQQLADANPEAFLYDDSKFVALLDAEDSKTREAALRTLASIGDPHPEALRPHAGVLHEALSDSDDRVRRFACKALGKLATEYPEEAKPAVPDLIDLLTDDKRTARSSAASTLAIIGEEYPDALLPAVDDLRANLTDDYDGARRYASKALGKAAKADVDKVRPAVPNLVRLLVDDRDTSRSSAASTLAIIGARDPDEIRQYHSRFVDRLDDNHAWTRRYASKALGKIAKAYPGYVKSDSKALDRLFDLLDDDLDQAQLSAAATLRHVAKEHPEAVYPAVGRLEQLLDHSNPRVQHYAAKALDVLQSNYPKGFTDSETAATDANLVSVVVEKYQRFKSVDWIREARTQAELLADFVEAHPVDDRGYERLLTDIKRFLDSLGGAGSHDQELSGPDRTERDKIADQLLDLYARRSTR
jgi:HEAT repeat protein